MPKKNKYTAAARQARAASRKFRMCERKRAYRSAEEAAATGLHVYRCPHCNQWHTSDAFRKFVTMLAEHSRRRRA